MKLGQNLLKVKFGVPDAAKPTLNQIRMSRIRFGMQTEPWKATPGVESFPPSVASASVISARTFGCSLGAVRCKFAELPSTVDAPLNAVSQL